MAASRQAPRRRVPRRRVPREIPQRELRNQVSKVLAEVAAGANFRVTVGGRPVADLVPVSADRTFVSRAEVDRILRTAPLDRGFANDLAAAVGATIEEL